MTKQIYDESSFRVLKGLEPVRERPGMYTDPSSPTHVLTEVVDNSADEALAGHAKSIHVCLFLDGSASVSDDGRGIPVGLHPEEQVPVVVLAYTRLHAGGKFDKKSGAGAYAFSGGLHGVGVAVTNALSTRVEVEVRRDGNIYSVNFCNGGEQISEIQIIGTCKRQTGTKVRIWPDHRYFDSPRFNLASIERSLRSKAVLLPGVAVTLDIEQADGSFASKTWSYPNGLSGYLADQAGEAELVVPLFASERYATESGDFAVGEGASWALGWYQESVPSESYVNLIPTPLGGTHETGLKAGVFEAVKSFAEHHAILPAKVKLSQEDVCGRMAFLLSAKVLDPQFQGQTKEKLNSRGAYKLVSQMVRDPFELWLNSHADFGKKIAELAVKAAQNRLKSTQKVEKKKSSGIATLPGKLTDCESDDITRNEIFLVEGDSAGGSAKQGRDKETQAVLPLRGKVLNTWEVDRDQLFKNNEVHDISVAVGVDPHGIDQIDTVDVTGLRYGRIIVMSDADVDGSHIQVLLFTLFLKHFPALVERGHIHVAQPPLFRVDVEARGHTRKIYCLDEDEKEQTLTKLRDEGVSENKISVSRFKGLGEMNPDQLWETTLCPDTRRLIPFQASRETITEMYATFTLLMAKGEAAGRRAWMEKDGGLIETDV